MAKLEYRNGCVMCNECGRLFEAPAPGDLPETECPCGRSEALDALGLVVETFNPPAPGDRPEAGPLPPEPPGPAKR